ncbi:hypothetical protein PT974_12570 [Cladobotryum mycophilum]|uniref:Uncharacterized protein n=1 Tax=Cladobotryum mycophilum TaxID=491253 RepID=A0ABR0S9T0_9HYPO
MFIQLYRSHSANSTVVGFVQEPDGRGTLSLLFSCIFTLTLCVWSAVHLNLPKHDESQMGHTYQYFKWSILGIFGPELVIWAAWRQYISARALTKFIQEGAGADKRTEAMQHWTMVHSFYAGMGGFIFDLTIPDMASGPSFIPNQRRLHVTPRGVQLLAQCGLLPDITRGDITDKSKTDGSGKLICCVQVAWMVIQAIARVAVGLPITPLETNTIGHVICALINYVLWWHKPRWINEPTVLRGEWARAMCAFMYMSSQVSAEDRADRDILRDFGVKTEVSGVLYLSDVANASDKATPQSRDAKVTTMCEDASSQTNLLHDGVDLIQRSLELVDNVHSSSGYMVSRHGHQSDTQSHWPLNPFNETAEGAALKDMRQTRWQLACEAIEKHPAIRKRLEPSERNQDELRYREALRLYPEMPDRVKQQFKRRSQPSVLPTTRGSVGSVCPSEELVVDRPRNWPGDDLVRHMQGHLMGLILWSASTVYGAVHLAGWNEHFPTEVESWFWRMSAAYIIFSGLLWSFLNLLGHASSSVWWFWYGILAGTARRHSYIVIYVLCFIGGTLYVVARMYLVVEAFVSLRALPASAYDSPSWVLTVPHL